MTHEERRLLMETARAVILLDDTNPASRTRLQDALQAVQNPLQPPVGVPAAPLTGVPVGAPVAPPMGMPLAQYGQVPSIPRAPTGPQQTSLVAGEDGSLVPLELP